MELQVFARIFDVSTQLDLLGFYIVMFECTDVKVKASSHL